MGQKDAGLPVNWGGRPTGVMNEKCRQRNKHQGGML